MVADTAFGSEMMEILSHARKDFLTEVQDGRTPNTLWLSEEVGHNQAAAREVKALFDDRKFLTFRNR